MDKKLKIYIDTSVFGGFFDEKFSVFTKNIFKQINNDKYICVVSDLTLQELEKAPKNVLNIYKEIPSSSKIILSVNDEAIELANLYINEKYLLKNSTMMHFILP